MNANHDIPAPAETAPWTRYCGRVPCVHRCPLGECFQDAYRAADRDRRLYQFLGKEVAAIASANGFETTTWENFTAKVLFAITELDEAVDGAETNLPEEIADTAIRLLATIHDLTGGDWASRIETRRPGRDAPPRLAPVEVQVWPIVSRLCKAAEAFRHDQKKDATIWIELALLECFRLADRLDFSLDGEILRKMAKNRGRDYLHGKASTLG